MPRYKLTIEYNGAGFAGWQKQPILPTVQQCLEEAVFKLCGEACDVVGAGRTDAGVHATGQTAHVDLPRDIDGYKVMQAINFHLQNGGETTVPVAVLSAEKVEDDFHARFQATRRYYTYRIINRRARLAVEHGRAWQVIEALDLGAMQKAADILVGHHDFSSFRDTECQAKSPIKTLDYLNISAEGEAINIRAHARSFLHHQVRIIVGTLSLVGRGKWSVEDVAKALAAKDRTAAGPTAPPDGLYLTQVDY